MSQTILVIDDEVNLREMVRLYLEREGYRVVEAANGRDALLRLTTNTIRRLAQDWEARTVVGLNLVTERLG